MAEPASERKSKMPVVLMAATAAALVAVAAYFVMWGGGVVAGLVFLFMAVPYGTGARALHRGESWGWGAGVLTAVFVALVGAFLLPVSAIAIVPAIGCAAVLYRTREDYGMVRTDPEAEARRREEFRRDRTANPEGQACPHCGATSLWIAPDGSAYCESCKVGSISVRPSG